MMANAVKIVCRNKYQQHPELLPVNIVIILYQ